MSDSDTPPGSTPDDDRLTAGWIAAARRFDSPNFDARPEDCVPELLVIHAISLPVGRFTTDMQDNHVADLFLNQLDIDAHPDFVTLKGMRVSAHFFIPRDGTLCQFVSVDRRAWHAGVSEWWGRPRCNDFSIGIELEGSDHVPFEPAQYDTLAKLTGLLIRHFPIRDIVGHQHIAPGRKTDPGPFFDWKMFRSSLNQHFPLVLANAAIRFPADR